MRRTAANPARAFTSACLKGDAPMVERFLAPGLFPETLSPDTTDQYGLSGLILAGRKGHVEVAKTLLAHGADIEFKDVRGRTALFHAATFKRYAFVEFLATRGANVNPVDSHGWTPLDFAVTSHFVKMTTLLERLGGKRSATAASAGE